MSNPEDTSGRTERTPLIAVPFPVSGGPENGNAASTRDAEAGRSRRLTAFGVDAPVIGTDVLSVDTFDGPRGMGDVNGADLHGVNVERLLASLDTPRSERPRRDGRPQWLRDLIDCVSDLFEPLSQTGRIGYQCQPANGRWTVEVFLSVAEHVGGPLDGHVELINFRFDVAALFRCFERVDDCTWSVFPTPEAIALGGLTRGDIPDGLSAVSIEGLVQGEEHPEPACVKVYSVPPERAGVGLKLFAGGDVRPV